MKKFCCAAAVVALLFAVGCAGGLRVHVKFGSPDSKPVKQCNCEDCCCVDCQCVAGEECACLSCECEVPVAKEGQDVK